jgi:general secretion pathway protein L
MNLLLLHLPSIADDCRAWLSGEGGLAEIGQGSVEHFASLHPGSACVIFLPSSLCLFASAAVSAKQLRQAEQSLAWLVEEQSGEDVESLHVIAGPQEGDETPLLAISRPVLQEWLGRLVGAGLRPIAVLPDLFLLARDDCDWQLAVRDGQAVLRTGPLRGAVLESDALELMLDAALRDQPPESRVSICVAVPDPALATRVESWAAGHEGIECRLAESADPAQALAAVPDWTLHPANFLQGGFAPRSRFRLGAGLRMAAAFVGAAFALQVASEWLHFGYYKYQTGKVAERVVARYKAAYPGERLPNTTASAMREVEKRMRGRRNENRSDGSVLPVLTRVAGSLQGTGLSTQRIDVMSGVLTLDVQARSLGELDGLKQRLDAEGLTTEIVSANAQGGFIRGRLRVEGGA